MCDCAAGQPCHGEVLADMVAAEYPFVLRTMLVSRASLVAGGRVQSAPGLWRATVSPAASAVPAAVSRRVTQEALDRNLRKIFPHHWLQHVPLPFLEDLINDETFLGFADWLDARGIQETGGGATAGVGGTGWRYVALGTQGGPCLQNVPLILS